MLTLSDFQYELPPGRIAQLPADRREEARMMIVDRTAANVRHAQVTDLPDTLRPGDLLVLNDTRVIPARLFGVKADGGAAVELLLLRRPRPLHLPLPMRRGTLRCSPRSKPA